MTEDASDSPGLLDDEPDDAPRSPLEPYREAILRWWRKGKSYRRIAALLHKRYGLTVAYSPLYRFVQRRLRPRKSKEERGASPAAPRRPGEYSAREIAAMREAARVARNRPPDTAMPERKVFVYDATKPISKE